MLRLPDACAAACQIVTVPSAFLRSTMSPEVACVKPNARSDDTGWGPCIDERARIGTNARSAAVVSIHADGGPATGRGFFVIAPTLIPKLTDDVFEPSSRLASKVRDAVRAGTSMPTSTYAGSNGFMTSGIYGGLNLADVPAMFIECGDMRNATDAALLTSATFRDQLATAITQGIANFVARR